MTPATSHGRPPEVAVVLEQRFFRTPDGAAWTPDAFSRPFWDRYLTAFDSVRIVARAEDVETAPPGVLRADGHGVVLHPVPYYLGPAGFLRRAKAVRQAVSEAVVQADAVVLRTPGTLSAVAYPMIRRRRQPFQTEVVGDPQDVFAPGVVPHPGRALFRWVFARALRAQCAHADVAAYVTAHALQERYPPGPGTFATHYSDVELAPDAFASHPVQPTGSASFTLVTVASMDQPYKAVDVQLEAVARLCDAGLDVAYRVVGEGRLRPSLQERARALGLKNRVVFVGGLPGAAAVRAELDRADLFLLPSRTEGLPRALVEAMARGLPCLATPVGGIPELLDPAELVPVDDAEALARAIRALIEDPGRRARVAAANLDRAQNYREAVLAERRQLAYRRLAELARPSRAMS